MKGGVKEKLKQFYVFDGLGNYGVDTRMLLLPLYAVDWRATPRSSGARTKSFRIVLLCGIQSSARERHTMRRAQPEYFCFSVSFSS